MEGYHFRHRRIQDQGAATELEKNKSRIQASDRQSPDRGIEGVRYPSGREKYGRHKKTGLEELT